MSLVVLIQLDIAFLLDLVTAIPAAGNRCNVFRFTVQEQGVLRTTQTENGCIVIINNWLPILVAENEESRKHHALLHQARRQGFFQGILSLSYQKNFTPRDTIDHLTCQR